MPQTIASLLDVAPLYDTFFVDMYGVIWDGKTFYPGVDHVFQTLKSRGKKIVMVSNTTALTPHMVEKSARFGLKKGIHYDDFITSGSFFKNQMEKGFLKKTLKGSTHRYYAVGMDNPSLFDGFATRMDNPVNADFVYMGSMNLPGEPLQKLDPLIPVLEQCLALNLPAICANPDLTFILEGQSYLANGAPAAWYENQGGTVIWLGKPHAGIFEYALEQTKSGFQSIVMIGDTVGTDILGANRAGIDSILITGTGITADFCKQGRTIDDVYAAYGAMATHELNCITAGFETTPLSPADFKKSCGASDCSLPVFVLNPDPQKNSRGDGPKGSQDVETC